MFSLVIQAGGQSARMGEDKGLKPFLGRPLIQRVIDRLALLADEIIITTNSSDAAHGIFQFDNARLTDAVPEPAMLSAAGLVLMGMLRRRSR